MAELIDLRSDTVTRPTRAMREAMYTAEVGDDVYGEDPTVNRLEEYAAEVAGKEAALFVPTGTMGNTIAIKCLTEHGQEVVCEARGHLLNYELSMTAWFAGCLIRPVAAEDGILRWAAIESSVRGLGPHAADTGCIEIENTHNMAGGTVYPQEVVEEICAESHGRGIKVHMDGARVFNAAAATGRTVAEICGPVDTVMFCLSKGLGAPAGSMLAGPRELIAKARLYRKRLGGGMRQAGILAAAALVAMRETPAVLQVDHANARLLAEGLSGIAGVKATRPETNIVVWDVAGTGRGAREVSAKLKEAGVLMNAINFSALRGVTHYDVTRDQCLRAVAAVEAAVA